MNDREKVVKGLHDLRRYLEDKEWSDYRVDRRTAKVYWQTVTDAIAMLKDQKPKPQRYKEHDPFHLPFCPNEDCNAVMDAYWHFCPYCGAPMVWDVELDEREMAVKWNA